MKMRIWSLAVLVLVVLFVAAGCRLGGEPETQEAGAPAGPEQSEQKTTLTLYFSDQEAQFLVPEVREVATDGLSAEEAVVKELIAGPTGAAHLRTLPPETKLIAVSVTDGTASVDFSQEFQTKHWGGSTGEIMTVYSVVNSLANLPGINQVQFLIEGNKVETLAGHIELSQPLKPDWTLVPGPQKN